MHRHASQTLSPRPWLLALLLVSITSTICCRNRDTPRAESWQLDVTPSDQRAPDVSETPPDAAPDVDDSPCTIPKDASLPDGEHPWPVRAGGEGRRSQSPHPLPWPPRVGETFEPTFPGDNVGSATELRVDRRGRIHYVRLGSTGSSIVRLDPSNGTTERLAEGVAADSIRRDSLALAGRRVYALTNWMAGKTDELIAGIAGGPWQTSSFSPSNASTALLPSTGSRPGVHVVSGSTLQRFTTDGEVRSTRRLDSQGIELARGPGGRLYVFRAGGGAAKPAVTVFNAKGRRCWQHSFPSGQRDSNPTYHSPLRRGRSILAVRADGTLIVRLANRNLAGTRTLIAIDPSGKRAWRTQFDSTLASGPSVGPDGDLFLVDKRFDRSVRLLQFDGDGGDIVDRYDIPGLGENIPHKPVVGPERRLALVTSYDNDTPEGSLDTNLRGLLTIIDVDSGERRELKLHTLIAPPAPSQPLNAIRGPLAVGPAGQLYVVAQGTLKNSHYSPPTIFEIVDGP